MDDIEITKECLKVILKEGDLYDVIAQREGVAIPKNSFFKTHLFLFSRILYSGVYVFDKVKSYLSPVEKVKNAQDQIRKIAGVNIDIIRSKKRFTLLEAKETAKYLSPFLSVFYERQSSNKDVYLEDLKKIFYFCDLYKIDTVYLNEFDIYHLFPNADIDDLKVQTVFFKEILEVVGKVHLLDENSFPSSFDVEKTFDSIFLCLNLQELEKLITILEKEKANAEVLRFFRDSIEDIVVKRAINSYILDGDFDQLKEMVRQRLMVNANEEGVYRDRENGRIFQNVTIQDEYINIVLNDENGTVVENRIMKLSDYFSSLEDLEKEDIVFILALYLYLIGQSQISLSEEKENITFYDYVYLSFKEKQHSKLKHVSGMRTKGALKSTKFLHFLLDAYNTVLVVAMLLVTGVSVDVVRALCGSDLNEGTFCETFIENVYLAYKSSFQLEKEFVKSLLPNFKVPTFTNPFSKNHYDVGDVSSGKEDDKIATITSLTDCELPMYFGESYANYAEYEEGKFTHYITYYEPDYSKFEKVEELFQICYDVEPDYLQNCIRKNKFQFMSGFLYPVGDNYVITKIVINDKTDSEKQLVFSSKRVQSFSALSSTEEPLGNSITDAEIKLLDSMENPEIIFYFGISEQQMNSFVESLEKTGPYASLSSEEIKKAITDGLGMDGNSTTQEMFEKIKSKKYSETPISDAGLSSAIKNMDEREFFEAISSLDSLVCNLATFLAVNIEDDLIYVAGYYNEKEDEIISDREGHAWAMRKNGEIIDITPYDEEPVEQEISSSIENILNWCSSNNFSIYVALLLNAILMKKIFGKKVRFCLKVKKINRILTETNIEESYAKLMENLYGGINIPAITTPDAFLEKVENEFAGFDIDDLKELKKQICHSSQKKELQPSMKLLEELPFIRENSEEIKNRLLIKRRT